MTKRQISKVKQALVAVGSDLLGYDSQTLAEALGVSPRRIQQTKNKQKKELTARQKDAYESVQSIGGTIQRSPDTIEREKQIAALLKRGMSPEKIARLFGGNQAAVVLDGKFQAAREIAEKRLLGYIESISQRVKEGEL